MLEGFECHVCYMAVFQCDNIGSLACPIQIYHRFMAIMATEYPYADL